jgi:hypothetical protein
MNTEGTLTSYMTCTREGYKVVNSEDDGMHEIEPRGEEQRINNVHRKLQQVNGYQPDQKLKKLHDDECCMGGPKSAIRARCEPRLLQASQENSTSQYFLHLQSPHQRDT